MAAIIVIPARYASTRYPGKPLLNQTGKTLIEHVVEQARKAIAAARVVVATDDARIADAVRGFSGEVVMTGAHASGTDRIAEVMRRPEYSHYAVVVNVQGDEPEIEPELIDRLIHVAEAGAAPMVTAAAPFTQVQDIANPAMVKVVTDQRHLALYFSRSVIPHDRDGLINSARLLAIYRKHMGIYAYNRDFLLTLAAAPPCTLEQLEQLEQLRALYLGAKIAVEDAATAPHGIDTPHDYLEFVARWRGMRAPPGGG